MTHLNIQQGQNIEVVSTNLIKKLYEAALSVPEPLEGEQDAAYMSGNLQVAKTYRSQVEYLTNRFDDLHINVTDSYYIPFEDSAVLNVLLANNIGSDGIGITEAEAANATFTSSTFQDNTDITSFNTFDLFTKANTNPPTSLFKGCSRLQSIDLSGVTKVSQTEFANSGLSGDIYIPDLQSVGQGAFQSTSISTVSNLGSIESMSCSMFYDCPNLTSVVVPLTVTQIQNGAMSAYNKFYTRVLTTVTGLDNVTSYQSSVFNSQSELSLDITNLNKIQQLGDTVFDNCQKVYGVLNLPNLSNVSNNPGATFRKTAITKVQCLGNLTSIVGNMFYQNSGGINSNKLTEVYIPYECTYIGAGAFQNCVGLTTIKQYTISVLDQNWDGVNTPYTNISNVINFGNNCFNGCSSLNISATDINNATYIGSCAFKDCQLSGTLSLSNLTDLGSEAFSGTKISSVTSLGSTITEIPYNCFYYCNLLQSVSLPSTVTEIGARAFSGCTSLQSIDLSNITWLRGQQIFHNSGITSLSLPKIQKLSPYSLSSNNLSLVDLGEDLVEIGNQAFWDSSITVVIIRAITPPTHLSGNVTNFFYDMSGKTIYVPDNSVSAYQTAWPGMASNITGLSNYNAS